MSESELLSARDAMAALGINENDLQTLVARGDLRAFRAAGTMKFRRDDVLALKTEKGTEPTIIIPAAGARKSSGILARTATPGAPAAPVPAPAKPSADEIVLEDVELMPVDDATSTQQVTSQQPAAPVSGATTIQSPADQTGEATVMEAGAPVTAAPPSPVGPTARGSGVGAPAMSRVRQVGSGVTVASSRRTHAIYQAKSANPVWTVCMVLTTIVFVFAGSICGVMITKGFYDQESGQRIIPPFLSKDSQVPVYSWCKDKTPGDPQDEKQIP